MDGSHPALCAIDKQYRQAIRRSHAQQVAWLPAEQAIRLGTRDFHLRSWAR